MGEATEQSKQTTFQKEVIALLWTLIIGSVLCFLSMTISIAYQHKMILRQNKMILVKQDQILLQLSGKVNPIVIPEQVLIKYERSAKDKTSKKKETKGGNG